MIIFLLCVLVWLSNRSFETTDEGWYVLGYQPMQEISDIPFTYFHTLIKKYFISTDTSIQYFRIIRIILTVISCFILSTALTPWYNIREKKTFDIIQLHLLVQFGGIVSFGFGPLAISYNSLSLLFSTCIISGLIYLLYCLQIGYSSLVTYSISFLMGIFIVLQFIVKQPPSIILMGLSIGSISVVVSDNIAKIRYVCCLLAGFITGWVLFSIFFVPAHLYFYQILGITQRLNSGYSGHSFQDIGRSISNIFSISCNMVFDYGIIIYSYILLQIWLKTKEYFFEKMTFLYLSRCLHGLAVAFFTIECLSFKRLEYYGESILAFIIVLSCFIILMRLIHEKKLNIYLLPIPLVIIKLLPSLVSSRLNIILPILFLSTLLLLLLIFSIRYIVEKKYFNYILVVIILLSAPFSMAIGTNNPLFINVIFGVSFWFALLSILITTNAFSQTFRFVFLMLVSFYCCLFLHYRLIKNPHRAMPVSEQTEEIIELKNAKGLLFDKYTKNVLLLLNKQLQLNGFQEGDNIIGAYHLCGFIYLLGGYSPGNIIFNEMSLPSFEDEYIKKATSNHKTKKPYILVSTDSMGQHRFYNFMKERLTIDIDKEYKEVFTLPYTQLKLFEGDTIRLYVPN
jgi:hypothetical protein